MVVDAGAGGVGLIVSMAAVVVLPGDVVEEVEDVAA